MKDRLINALINDLHGYEAGFSLTLNTYCNDVMRLEQNVLKLFNSLNRHCYGRQYRRGEKRFKVVGVTETGEITGKLHIHLLVMYNNDTSKTVSEIEEYIRGTWYLLINANPKAAKSGSLVHLRSIYDLAGITRYINKHFNRDQYNPLYY